MVGTGTKIRRPGLAEITSEVVGKSYELGCTDCFALIIYYLQKQGVPIPDEYEGITLETYADFYKKDPENTLRLMVGFINRLLVSVHPNKAPPGSIYLLSLKGRDVPSFLALDGGNTNVVFATEERGIIVMPLSHYEIEGAWIWAAM